MRGSIKDLAPVSRADLLFVNDQEPVTVVEVKGRAIATSYQAAVRDQLRHHAQITDSRWAVLADPDSVLIFPASNLDTPLASIPTAQVLRWAGVESPRALGESVLTLAIERWLTNPERLSELSDSYPALRDFAQDMRHSTLFQNDDPS